MNRTWTARDLRAPWRLVEIELTEPTTPLCLDGAHGAFLLLRHAGRPVGRLLLGRSRFGDVVAADRLASLIRESSYHLASAYAMRDALGGQTEPAPIPPLTIAVCTRNRASLLGRTLSALVAMRETIDAEIAVLVVDNAPVDSSTRAAAQSCAGVSYVVEPVPGLNFARNRALSEVRTEFLAFIDDDAVPDRGWLAGFAESLRDRPDAGGFTGPVLPMKLETEAQIRFEAAGGFGEGLAWHGFHRSRWGDPIYPAGAGRLATGANMIFRVATLRTLGGFDEALDTGPPLPGGGDLDICYRLVRSGRPLVYCPRQAVHHEHRRDLAGLRKQYRSWGLSLGALYKKNWHADPGGRAAHRRLLLWLMVQRYGRLLAGIPLGQAALPLPFVLAEMAGLAQGLTGEYRRSERRIAQRRAVHAR